MVNNSSIWDLTAETEQQIVFWNYKNSLGYVYPRETYSRYIFKIVSVDTDSCNENQFRVTVQSADVVTFSGVTKKLLTEENFPIGTYCSQAKDGSAHKYFGMVGSKATSDWTEYQATFSGTDPSGANVSLKFPPGTFYTKFMLILNYNQKDPNSQNSSQLDGGQTQNVETTKDLTKEIEIFSLSGKISEIMIRPGVVSNKPYTFSPLSFVLPSPTATTSPF